MRPESPYKSPGKPSGRSRFATGYNHSPDLQPSTGSPAEQAMRANGLTAALRAEARLRHSGSSHFLVSCHRDDYAASGIVRAVEDCDVHLLHLEALPHPESPESFTLVSLATAPCNPAHIVASLERYGYEVIDADTPISQRPATVDEDPLRERVSSLLRLIDI